MKHLNLMFPQWQGGGPDLSTYYGAREFRELYLSQVPLSQIEVDTREAADTGHLIFGYPSVVSQLQSAHTLIRREAPDTLFTLGGGCDAGLPAASYLNQKYNGDLTVLWFDSHGDLNTPLSSPSRYFYGMPLRALLGDGDEAILHSLPSTISPRQAVLLGVRDLDAEELNYIQTRSVRTFSVPELEADREAVAQFLRAGHSQNLYIHIDLDVLDPAEFPYVPLPSPGGLRMETLQATLLDLHAQFRIVGLDVMEYTPTRNKRYPLLEAICAIGAGLSVS